MRHLFFLVSIGLILGGCEKLSITGPDPDENRSNIQPVREVAINVGPSMGEIFFPLEDGEFHDPSQTIRDAWDAQQNLLYVEDAHRDAEKIASARFHPDQIALNISIISVPGLSDARPPLSADGTGGYLTTLLDALRRLGLRYEVIGEGPPADHEITLTMLDGGEYPATFYEKEILLGYKGDA